MEESIGIALLYLRENKNSFNALIGALESVDHLPEYKLYFINKEKDFVQDIESISKHHSKIIFAVSFSTPQYWDIQIIAQEIKSFYPNILMIAGGPHPSGDPKSTLNLGFDIVVRNEGEETFIEIIKVFGDSSDLKHIKGISYKNEIGEIINTGRRNPYDLNKSIPISQKYHKYGHIEITRGCPFVCSFCQNSFILGTRPRHRSIETISRYVNIMKERNLNDFRAISPNAFSYGSEDGKTLNLNAIDNLLASVRSIIGNNGRIFFGTFPSEIRPEHVTAETMKILQFYADNDNIIIGAQTASRKLLEYCHRGHTLEDVNNAIELALLFNFKVNIDLIFGMPGETMDDMRYTMNFIRKYQRKNIKIHGHFFIPLPQTKFMYSEFKPLSDDIRKELVKLSNKGILYGDWQKQETLSMKILQTFR